MLRKSWPPFLGAKPSTIIKGLKLRLPSLPLQKQYEKVVQKFERLRAQQREVARQADHLFATLLPRAFREEI